MMMDKEIFLGEQIDLLFSFAYLMLLGFSGGIE
jgi:hypothetical protein